ncbi:MAG: Ppx/GppA family phosphatase, partial [Candidatus Kapaibacteriota bacterium]
MKRYYAGIDIGTNTLLLLILSKDHSGVFQVEQDIHRIARLGEGVHEHGIISRNAIQRAVSILREYH